MCFWHPVFTVRFPGPALTRPFWCAAATPFGRRQLLGRQFTNIAFGLMVGTVYVWLRVVQIQRTCRIFEIGQIKLNPD